MLGYLGGASSAVRVQSSAVRAQCSAQCARSATIWASGRIRDPYFEILGPLGASW